MKFGSSNKNATQTTDLKKTFDLYFIWIGNSSYFL